jgi:hypothetical protein
MEPSLQKLIFEHIGILISLAFIVFLVRYMNTKIHKFDDKEWLTRFVSLLLTTLTGLFVADKLIISEKPLLTPEMSDNLFELIKNIVLIIFGYQVNAASSKKSKNDDCDENTK